MKNFKLIALLVGLFAGMAASAQTRVVSTTTASQGQTIIFGASSITTPVDSLQVTDSLAYAIPISHTNDVSPVHSWYWNKIGTGSATITLAYLQSMDGTNWFAVPKGVAATAYTKTMSAVAASTWYYNDFKSDSAVFSGRYLKVYYITSATASVKGKLINILKTNIR